MPIDRDKLRAALRKLGNDRIYAMLGDAIGLLPPSKLVKLAERYFDAKSLDADPENNASLLAQVKTFEKASLASEYYENFAVNSKSYREMSGGTRAWIAECQRLLDRCVAATKTGDHTETREAIETIFGLLRHIDECLDDIVFFADEAGSWQVGVDWGKVLPAWFVCLSATTDPEEYARRAIEVVGEFAEYNRDKHLAVAGRKATPAQRKALAAISAHSGGGKAGKRQRANTSTTSGRRWIGC